MGFREIVKREADKQEMSGYRLAQLSGVPMRTVQRFLSGTTDVTAHNLEAIARALGLELRPAARKSRKRKS